MVSNQFHFFNNLQIKEGAEKLREVARDRRALSDVATIVKKSNSKLAELKSELHELESQIILTQGNRNEQGTTTFFVVLMKFHAESIDLVGSRTAQMFTNTRNRISLRHHSIWLFTQKY